MWRLGLSFKQSYSTARVWLAPTILLLFVKCVYVTYKRFTIPCATLYYRAIVVLAVAVLVVGVLHCIVGPTFWLCCYPHAQAILC